MEIFARQNRVLFIETVGTRTPGLNANHLQRIIQRVIKWMQGPRKILEFSGGGQLYVFAPLVIPLYESLWAEKINRWIMKQTLRGLMRKLGMENPILWFYLPTASYLIGELGEKKVIYHCVDEWSTYPGFHGKRFQEMDANLFRKADWVFASNPLLAENKKKLNPQVEYIPHGVEFEHYQQPVAEMEIPYDIRKLKRPVIAMIGAVSNWIDWKPILYAARRHPEWSFVLVGPVGYDAELEPLKEFPNIHLLGKKPYEELPRYYAAIDVCMISFKLNDHIRYCFPTRLYEHLAAGKPVVATDFPAAHELPEAFIKIARNEDAFCKALEESFMGNPGAAAERKSEAQKNSWMQRAEKMSQRLETLGVHS